MPVPLPHQTPEYVAANRGPTVIGVVIAMSVLSTVFVAARIFTRAKLMGKMFLDDWLVIISSVSQWICVGFAVKAVTMGNGRHFDILSTPGAEGALLYTMLNFPFGIIAFGLPKIAVVALLVRIMNPDKWHRIFLWCLSIGCAVVLSGCTVILFAQCTPAASQWDFSITEKTCWDRQILVGYAIGAGSFSAFTDLYLAVYPAVVLWSLQMHLKKKIALSVALGIGSVSTVVAIYKCTRLPSLASPDFTWDTADLVIWTIVEGAVIIIACCIPLLQPFVDFVFGRRTLSGSYGYKNYGSTRDGKSGRSRDVELSHTSQAIGGSSSRGGTSKGSRGEKYGRGESTTVTRIHKFDDVMDGTASDDNDAAETGSQRSILRDDSMKHPVQHSTTVEPGPISAPSGREMSNDARIIRTDVVTVSYSSEGGRLSRGDKDWGAI